MTQLEAMSLAAAIIAVSLAFYIPSLKGIVIMSSQAFTDALAANSAAWQSKVAAAQNQLDAANATIAQLQANVVTDTGPQVDAEDTAAVIAATPQ